MLSMRQRHQQYHKKPQGGGQVKKVVYFHYKAVCWVDCWAIRYICNVNEPDVSVKFISSTLFANPCIPVSYQITNFSFCTEHTYCRCFHLSLCNRQQSMQQTRGEASAYLTFSSELQYCNRSNPAPHIKHIHCQVQVFSKKQFD